MQDRALLVLQVADEHDLKFGKALGRCLGAANTGIGLPEDGLAEVRDGLDLYHSLKTPPVFRRCFSMSKHHGRLCDS